MSQAEPIEQLRQQGRVVRGAASGAQNGQGQPVYRLYPALIGDPYAHPKDCPPAVAPKWLAYLLPWMEGGIQPQSWNTVLQRVAALETYLPTVSANAELRVRREIVLEIQTHVTEQVFLDAIAQVLTKLDQGDPVSDAEWDMVTGSVPADDDTWCVKASVRVATAGDLRGVSGGNRGVSSQLAASILTEIENDVEI